MKKTFVCRLALALVVCICFSTIAISAAPSIELKPTPEIITPAGSAEDVGAIITNGSEKEEIKKSDITAISYDEARAYAGSDENIKNTCAALVEAYNAFKVENVEGIDEFVKTNLNVKNPNYFISELFEINIGDKASMLDGDAKITISFSNAIVKAESGKLVVAHMVNNKWEIVPASDIVVTADVIKVSFDQLCPVVFLTVSEDEAADVTPDTEDTQAPSDTEDTQAPSDTEEPADDNNVLVIVLVSVGSVIVLAAVAFVVAYVILKKKGIVDQTFVGKSVNKVKGIFKK